MCLQHRIGNFTFGTRNPIFGKNGLPVTMSTNVGGRFSEEELLCTESLVPRKARTFSSAKRTLENSPAINRWAIFVLSASRTRASPHFFCKAKRSTNWRTMYTKCSHALPSDRDLWDGDGFARRDAASARSSSHWFG